MYIFTDGGRLCRPLLYYDTIDMRYAFERAEILKALQSDNFSWKSLVVGMNAKIALEYRLDSPIIYTPMRLYGVETILDIQRGKIPSIIEYVDTAEEESLLITL
jgi:hypothetical protein